MVLGYEVNKFSDFGSEVYWRIAYCSKRAKSETGEILKAKRS